jgi:hypothetical protein
MNVGRVTEEIVKELNPEEINRNVLPSRINQVRLERVVAENAGGILEYWSKRSIGGLLLMPPTRHCFVHLNEAVRVRRKVI